MKISQGYFGLWTVVSKKWIFYLEIIHWCWLGKMCRWPKKHKWRCIICRKFPSFVVKKQIVINLAINCRSQIHCNNILFHTSSLDESHFARHLDWLKKSISILCDNISAIKISKNPSMHSKTKNIPIKYHFLRDNVENQVVKIEYVITMEKIVNIFTKQIPIDTIEYLKQNMGVIPIFS